MGYPKNLGLTAILSLSFSLVGLLAWAQEPDLSRLSADDQQSIELACLTDKVQNGPAAYYKCLNAQLAKLSGPAPDLSRSLGSSAFAFQPRAFKSGF